MSELECPYCHADCGEPDDCNEQERGYEWECEECGKKFIFNVDYTKYYFESKADCLNGGKHKWENICGVPKEMFKNKYRCSDCGKEEKRE